MLTFILSAGSKNIQFAKRENQPNLAQMVSNANKIVPAGALPFVIKLHYIFEQSDAQVWLTHKPTERRVTVTS